MVTRKSYQVILSINPLRNIHLLVFVLLLSTTLFGCTNENSVEELSNRYFNSTKEYVALIEKMKEYPEFGQFYLVGPKYTPTPHNIYKNNLQINDEYWQDENVTFSEERIQAFTIAVEPLLNELKIHGVIKQKNGFIVIIPQSNIISDKGYVWIYIDNSSANPEIKYYKFIKHLEGNWNIYQNTD